MKLYPLKFSPLFKYRIWGGEKLKTELLKEYTEENIGESWEISDVPGDETEVTQGNLQGKTLKDLISEYKGDFVGEKVYKEFGNDFPLLIKFIDAKTPLSIQVHPSNEIAKERHNSFGKNEMWYVMQADENSELIVGFDQEVSQEDYKKHLENNTILDVMHHENVKSGDTFYIPTGRVHAIGAGVLLAEIQQTSDVTYRIYDYDRVDAKTGEKRDLHNDLAIDVLDYKVHDNYRTSYEIGKNETNTLVNSPYFKTNIIEVDGELNRDYSTLDSFVIYICVEGTLELHCNNSNDTIKTGETILLPAAIDSVTLKSDGAKCIEVFM
ncbi:mannose-6-phosphate isomerase [Tamlana sp. 2_MG-2023]|uniref:type I phosphomannose isomerase catalytic subunit n=1 Tax=unclassified Tamlana TaxID=2614803 RepID=UPI0026E28A10|nr:MULTISPECIES: type I phosphomannose isomerase catalytic subunit [unclassified Tamlana]MDO6758926.1 mannose-6-phosphate isomerase [Tamlana sp. 2_MG-2023]MDO6789625.1 mannose-6-phosphate isomerase [Tamlana sp. 1_MG-2023]